MALADFLLRRVAWLARDFEPRGSGKSGRVFVDAGDAEVLARASCTFVGETLELGLRIGLPGRGRRIAGRAAAQVLARRLPELLRTLAWPRIDQAFARRHVDLVDDHAHLQAQLDERGLVAFVRDGSILARATGVSSEPLEGAVPFESPASLRVTLPTRHHGEVHGMGLPVGVTLITGGGFHGKTTLLTAICRGIHPHILGDGREWVVTSPEAVKVRSEDGRSVVGVDLRGLIGDLPGARDTSRFSTPNASGSTSLAATILESLEAGARALLLDEDTCATNLLIRDARMQELVAHETITPLIDHVRPLYEQGGVSTVFVIGGSGDYLEVADTVILVDNYRAQEITARAREVMAAHPTGRAVCTSQAALSPTPRRPRRESFNPWRGARRKAAVRARGIHELQLGEQEVELAALEQLVDASQTRAIGAMLAWLYEHGARGGTVRELSEQVLAEVARGGLRVLDARPEMAQVRRFELIAALNRLRALSLAED